MLPPATGAAGGGTANDNAVAADAVVGVIGNFWFLNPLCLTEPELLLLLLAFALAADTGTVIVEAEVTATEDALVAETVD